MGDFLESEVWEVMGGSSGRRREQEQAPVGLLSRQLEAGARPIPRDKGPAAEVKMAQNSAPVNVPNWSKIYGKSARKGGDRERTRELECEEDQEEDCRLPPHEWLARNEARNQVSSFSVYEGAGRTLKGRDLSRVRHAVLTKTGFI